MTTSSATARSKTPRHPRTVTSFEEAEREYAQCIKTFAYNTIRQLPGWEVEDVVQELLMVLWKCYERYDAGKGASFNTLFQGCAKNKCITLIRSVNTAGRKGIAVTLEDEAVRTAAEEASQYMSVEDIVMMNCELNLLYTPEEIARAVRPDNLARARAKRDGRLAS